MKLGMPRTKFLKKEKVYRFLWCNLRRSGGERRGEREGGCGLAPVGRSWMRY